jgi:hypothetical protein
MTNIFCASALNAPRLSRLIPFAFCLSLFVVPIDGSTQYAPPDGNRFPWAGEQLHYSLYFNGARAMQAVIKSGQRKDSEYGDYIPLSAMASSVGFFDQIYPVNDSADTFIAPDTYRPKFSRKVFRESSDHRTYEVDYDQPRNSAFVEKKSGDKRLRFSYYIPEETHDMMSWLAYLRAQAPSKGKKLSFYIYDGWKLSRIDITYLKRESLYIQMGWFNTWKLKFVRHIVSSGKISQKKPNQTFSIDMKKKAKHSGHIWLSRDQRHIPVQLRIGTKFGNIEVVLTRYNPPMQGES